MKRPSLRYTLMSLGMVATIVGSLSAYGIGRDEEPPFLAEYLLLPKLATEMTFQDHNRSCAICVRFTQGRVTTRALEILQAHFVGKAVEFDNGETGVELVGSIKSDGLEFPTPCPVFMYIYKFKSDGLSFSDLAKFAMQDEYDNGQLGITRGKCSQ